MRMRLDEEYIVISVKPKKLKHGISVSWEVWVSILGLTFLKKRIIDKS